MEYFVILCQLREIHIIPSVNKSPGYDTVQDQWNGLDFFS